MSAEEEAECKKIISKDNYYDILGIEKNATTDQIKKAYRKLAIKFHPDKNKAKSAEEAFKKVNQAFSVLSDENKRKNYDMFGKEDLGGGPHFADDINPFDIFNMFFQDSFGPMGNMGNMGGNTTFRFSNGNGSFTVFSSGPGFDNFFGGMNNNRRSRQPNDFDPFADLFGFSDNMRRRNTQRNNNSNRGGGRRQNEEFQKAMRNLNICLNLMPVICCIMIFFVFPAIFRAI